MNTACTLFYFVSVFLSAHVTTFINNTFGISASFLAFGIINMLLVIITFLFVLETKGLSYDKHKKSLKNKQIDGTNDFDVL